MFADPIVEPPKTFKLSSHIRSLLPPPSPAFTRPAFVFAQSLFSPYVSLFMRGHIFHSPSDSIRRFGGSAQEWNHDYDYEQGSGRFTG
jgi:hypothetical protein